MSGMDKKLMQIKMDQANLAKAITEVQQNMSAIVSHVNQWVARIQGIDKVAYAAFLMHEGKEMPQLDEKTVEQAKKNMNAAIEKIDKYSQNLQKEAQKNAAKSKSQQRREEAMKKPKIIVPPKKKIAVPKSSKEVKEALSVRGHKPA